MQQHAHQLSRTTRIIFGPTVVHDVSIEKGPVRLVLTADEWDAIVDRSPYMRVLAERYP